MEEQSSFSITYINAYSRKESVNILADNKEEAFERFESGLKISRKHIIDDMNKILFVGDIHGRAGWRELALEGLKTFHEIVLLGDYVDSREIRPITQLENLKAIVTFLRKKGKGRMTALLGNHDYAYINGKFSISGFQPALYPDFKKIFDDNRDIFQIAWGRTNPDTQQYTLATHAGLTSTFWNKYILPLTEEKGFVHEVTSGNIPKNIHEILNLLTDKVDILWKVGSMRGGVGTPGPLWADHEELIQDPFPHINQVVGHTPNFAPTIKFNSDNHFIARIDSWGSMKVASFVVSL